jgi:hypothetical protein
MPGRPNTAYEHAWGLTEQPTTIVTSIGTGTFGNLMQVNVPGRIVGMRWGHAKNVTDKGAVGILWEATAPTNMLRVCRARPNTTTGVAGVAWVNMWFHPWFRPTVNHSYMVMLQPVALALAYNDGALLAADLTIGHFKYPKDTANPHNGATNGTGTLYPVTTANGRRYALDLLFLPD